MKVICHTHWDREWFAPSSVTNAWLKELFERLFDLVSKRKDYRYVLDGQTLIVEDLLSVAPEFEGRIRELVGSGNLLMGPLYAQIDFRLSPEIAIIKNFEMGKKDMEKFGTKMNIAWMVDNFGFISQLPQLLNRYGIEGAFIWRGVNLKKPSIEFLWRSKDGSSVKCIFLIGGYRNLFGLSRTKAFAEKRLQHEIKKLRVFSLSGCVPLLDGYDLDTEPEDPREILGEKIVVSTPQDFLREAFLKVSRPPEVEGELLSGKYACVFPGTLSTRVYLKLQSHTVARLLRYVELLSFFDKERIDELHRMYLKTLIHDNICGVGIDKIHRDMTKTYRKLYSSLRKSFAEKLSKLAGGLRRGVYVLSFSPFEYDHWYCDGEYCYRLKSDGAGIFRVNEFDRTRADQTLSFRNDHYEASFLPDGTLKINDTMIGIFKLERELGDSYSTDTERLEFSCRVLKIEVERSGEKHKIVRMERIVEAEDVFIETKERIVFDETPLVKWFLTVESSGKNYLLSFVTKTKDRDSKVLAKMPFDVVERNRIDEDLLPLDINGELSSVLLAAREVGSIRKFPFQGFVALQSEKTTAIMAKGVHQYGVNEEGDIEIDLVRSVEWIAKSGVGGRTGDAGPLMYVPDARCEGAIDFELAFFQSKAQVRTEEFFKWFNLFDDPPVLFSVEREDDSGADSVGFFAFKLPWVCVEDGGILVYNPYSRETHGLKPHQIGTLPLASDLARIDRGGVKIRMFNFPKFPQIVFRKVVREEIMRLEAMIEEFRKRVQMLRDELKKIEKTSKRYHETKHRLLSGERTLLELEVSLALVRGKVPVRLMRRLNELRAKRRIYDYVIELLREGS